MQTSRFFYISQGVLEMKCPNCGDEKSRVLETRKEHDRDKRIRICSACSTKFTTLEVVVVFAGKAAGYTEVKPIELSTSDVPKVPGRYVARETDECLMGCCPQARGKLVQWWNESRWSKHKAKATWTKAAFDSSVGRVAGLPAYQQEILASAGIESGWQTLKREYLSNEEQRQEGSRSLAPKDLAMRNAIDQWNQT